MNTIERRIEPSLALYVEVERRPRGGVEYVIVSCAHCHTRLAIGTDLDRTVRLSYTNRAIRPCCNKIEP